MYSVNRAGKERKKRRRKKEARHLFCTILILRLPGIVQGYDAPDTLVSLCFVDDFTRVGHLRRDKPDNGRSSCLRKTVSQSHLVPSRINEKKRGSASRRLSARSHARFSRLFVDSNFVCLTYL